jgi:hypothetical protein
MFYNIGSYGLYCKTLQNRNLREMDRFRGKLVTFGIGKHTSLDKQTHQLTTESTDYNPQCFIIQTPDEMSLALASLSICVASPKGAKESVANAANVASVNST